MNTESELILRGTAGSLCCDLLTDAPFQMGDLQIEKVGFAETPVVFVTVACSPKAISVIVPVARQFTKMMSLPRSFASGVMHSAGNMSRNSWERSPDADARRPVSPFDYFKVPEESPWPKVPRKSPSPTCTKHARSNASATSAWTTCSKSTSGS